MMKLTKKAKIAISILSAAAILATAPFVIYLKVLPAAVSNPSAIEFAQVFLQKNAGLNLSVKNPELKTSLSPDIEFSVDEISLTRGKTPMFSAQNFDMEISFKNIFKKKIIVKKLGTDYIFADVNKLSELAPKSETKQTESDWDLDFFDSLLYLKKSEILFNSAPDTLITVKADDLKIDNTQKLQRFIHFNIKTEIAKADNKLHIAIADNNRVYIKDKKIFVKDCVLNINDSKIHFNAQAAKNKNFFVEVYADKFSIPNVVELVQSNIIENNLNEPLSYFKNIDGTFDFKIKLTSNDLNGKITLNKLSFNLVPVANLPVLIEHGEIDMTKDVITLKDFKGIYNGKKANVITCAGTVKDYLKSIDTNIKAQGIVSNDFSKNYLSKMIGYPIELKGNVDTILDLKSINNKIDLTWFFRLKEGDDILVDGQTLSPTTKMRRYLIANLHFEDMLLNMKSIDYYVIPDYTKQHKRTPIITLKGNVDFKNNGLPNVLNIGYEIPKPLPSEIMNVFIGQKLFKKGTIAGNLHVNNTGKYPTLNGKMEINKIIIPSQRLFIKSGVLFAGNGLVHLSSAGRYRRSSYDFSGDIVNEIKFPVIVKDINLEIDNVDVEKFLAVSNNTSTPPATIEAAAQSNIDEDNDDNTQTFDLSNLIIENCVLSILKGTYKDINFSNVKATMSLDKNSLLKMYSNRFEIAEGHSSAKVECDLKNHKYNIILGIKDVNSDIIATSLLALKKEISGKASGLIILNTDDSLKLNGSIKFAIKNGTIGKIGLVEYILKFAALFRNPIAMISPSTISDLVNIPDGSFDKINGDLLIKNNVVEKIMIKSSASQLASFIIGRFDLESRDATLRIYTKFSSKNKGFYGALRNISLNSLANRIPLSSRNDSNYYASELEQIPAIDADEKDCQVFLTKVDGDVEHNNFLSSLKKIK